MMVCGYLWQSRIHLFPPGPFMFAPSSFQMPSKCLPYRPVRAPMRGNRRGRSDKAFWGPGHHMPLSAGPVQESHLVLPISRAALLDALSKEQIQAWLQPKVEIESQQLVGVEALARWRHPQWGMLAPSVFLPWFSEHGLDEALLMHMLKEVLGLQAYWRRQEIVLSVAVNLPTHLLDDATLPDRLMERVQASEGNAADITFELLEDSTTMTPCALFMGACRLVSMGFGLAQDDGGVAFSSMERLCSTPFSELKLDRSVVNGLAHDDAQAAQVESWITAAKQRGLLVTAEGVEAPADLALLQEMGCDYAQGYLFAKPTSAFELDMWMRQRWAA